MGTPEADSSGTVRVIGMVIRVVFMGCVKNVCSYGRIPRRGEGCKPRMAGDLWCLPGGATQGIGNSINKPTPHSSGYRPRIGLRGDVPSPV